MANVMREDPEKVPNQRNLNVWTEDEEVDQRFADEKFINMKIQEYFPNKTSKQVSDKQRDIKLKSRRANKSASTSTRPNAIIELSSHPHSSGSTTQITDLNEIYRPEVRVKNDSKVLLPRW